VDALLLPVAAWWCALDLRRVREILAGPSVTPVPAGPPALLGLVNVRGEIVPLFDTAVLVGAGGGARAHGPPFAAVVGTGRGPAALAASGPPEVVELGEPLATEEGHDPVYAAGTRLVSLLDPEVVVAGA
jgi:purine-binding chemotaxis protein CheW